jgi:UDP-N-acetylglucosamine---dolichyl-phosphate N-acetylglucosaminyltransferase
MQNNIFIVIPAYNEERHLPEVIEKIQSVNLLSQTIVVDDGSDKPLKKISGKEYLLLKHSSNLGKGAAMKTGAGYAFSHGADAVVFLDADGQHDPTELPKFIEKLNSGYDLVFGSRMMPINTPLLRFIGNKFASFYVSLVFDIYISDILSGYRGLSKKAYKAVLWKSNDYSVEMEMIARLAQNKNRLKYVEFPILGIYFDQSKGMGIWDAMKVFIQSLLWKSRLLLAK